MALLTDGLGNEFQGHSAIAFSIRSVWLAAGGATKRIVTALLVWEERARQRRQLLALNELALKDIGRARADAAGEAGKPFWQA